MTQIWLEEKDKNVCVIPDCFGTSPLVLIADLKRQDQLDGTVGGKYYIKRKRGKLR